MTRYRTQEPTGISFPMLECWNPMINVATIAAQVSGRRVLCRISMDVLKKKFSATEEAPMQAVKDNRRVIQAAARELIESNTFQDDGNIVIRQKDIATAMALAT